MTIQDSITGARFPFFDLRASVTDGAYRDSLHVAEIVSTPPRPFWLASERAGTYNVTVEARGYQRWTKNGVVVRQLECNKVVPAELNVRLQPLR